LFQAKENCFLKREISGREQDISFMFKKILVCPGKMLPEKRKLYFKTRKFLPVQENGCRYKKLLE
jgi:hypothetical protein